MHGNASAAGRNPHTFDAVDGGETRRIDVEVNPAPASINSGAFLAFFP
jgi:hypothetical protein